MGFIGPYLKWLLTVGGDLQEVREMNRIKLHEKMKKDEGLDEGFRRDGQKGLKVRNIKCFNKKEPGCQ